MGHPLARFPIVSTRDPDEAQFVLSRELAELRLRKVRDRSAFGLEMNGVPLGRTVLAYNEFATDTVVDPGEVAGAVLLLVGVGPPAILEIDGERIVCAERGAIVSPSRRVLIRRPAGSGLLILKAGFDAIEGRFRETVDPRPGKPIQFGRSVDLAEGVGAQAQHFLRSTAEDVERDNAFVDNPLLRAGFDDMMLSIILALPNNYSDELMSSPRSIGAPGLVRRAEEFLEAQATEPITISDLVAECGCSRRVLFSAFRRHRGYTPMQFLAECRLRATRQALLSPLPGDTVTSIAYACGFSHRGRFSDAYRRRFGETPSETVRKA